MMSGERASAGDAMSDAFSVRLIFGAESPATARGEGESEGEGEGEG